MIGRDDHAVFDSEIFRIEGKKKTAPEVNISELLDRALEPAARPGPVRAAEHMTVDELVVIEARYGMPIMLKCACGKRYQKSKGSCPCLGAHVLHLVPAPAP